MSYIDPLGAVPKNRMGWVVDPLRGRFCQAFYDYEQTHMLNGTAQKDVADALMAVMPLMGLTQDVPTALTKDNIENYLSYRAQKASPPESVVRAMEILSEGFLDHHALLDIWEDTGLIDDDGRVLDQARLTQTLSAWRARYGLNQAELGVQSQVTREVICRIEKGTAHGESNFRTLSNLADFFDLKWRMEPYKGKDYVPGQAILARWQANVAQGVAFKDVLRQEMEQNDIKNQGFAIPLFSREIINRYLNSPTSKAPPSHSVQASLARIFERLEAQREYGIEIPGALGESIAHSKTPPEDDLTEVQHEGVCAGKDKSRKR